MKNQIVNLDVEGLIMDYYSKKGDERMWKKNLSALLNNMPDEYEKFKNDKFPFLINPSDYQIMWHVINGDYEHKKCRNCGGFTRFNRQFFYHDTCSRKCSAIISGHKDPEARKKITEKSKKTCLMRYGVDSPSKLDEFKDKVKKTNIEKYGKDSPMKNTEIQKKQFKKMQETNIKRYGVKSTLSDERTKEKIRNTLLNKYGVDHQWKSELIRKKSGDTMESRYGARIYSKTRDWMNRFMLHEWGNRYYEYKMPSGEAIKIQGYENFALDALLKEYDESEIEVKKKPRIFYEYEGKRRTYRCDIMIPGESRIIEVKSKFTYELQINKNIEKAKACLSAGYSFEFWIINRKGDILIEKFNG